MTKRILAIAGCFPVMGTRASRPLAEDEKLPNDPGKFFLRELEQDIYIQDVDSDGGECYLPEETVHALVREHGWEVAEQSAVV